MAQRLELQYCTKLESDVGLSAIKDSIEWLSINISKKFEFSTELIALKNLKVLCLNECGPIKNLNFLSQLPNLVDFRFVDTKILDGDLTPILEHPNILNAGFLNKNNFSHKAEYIQEILNKRCLGRKISIFKGEYKTYKYDIFE